MGFYHITKNGVNLKIYLCDFNAISSNCVWPGLNKVSKSKTMDKEGVCTGKLTKLSKKKSLKSGNHLTHFLSK